MPLPALAAVLFISGGFLSSARDFATDLISTVSSPAAVVLAFDDEAYDDRADEDENAEPIDPDFNYYDRDREDEGPSAHAPDDDDDDGWDVDPLNKSEWA